MKFLRRNFDFEKTELEQERKFAIIDNVIISDSRCREKTSWHFMVAMLKRRLPTIDKLVSECATESVFGTHILDLDAR